MVQNSMKEEDNYSRFHDAPHDDNRRYRSESNSRSYPHNDRAPRRDDRDGYRRAETSTSHARDNGQSEYRKPREYDDYRHDGEPQQPEYQKSYEEEPRSQYPNGYKGRNYNPDFAQRNSRQNLHPPRVVERREERYQPVNRFALKEQQRDQYPPSSYRPKEFHQEKYQSYREHPAYPREEIYSRDSRSRDDYYSSRPNKSFKTDYYDRPSRDSYRDRSPRPYTSRAPPREFSRERRPYRGPERSQYYVGEVPEVLPAPYRRKGYDGFDFNDSFNMRFCNKYVEAEGTCFRKACQFYPCYTMKSPARFDCAAFKHSGKCDRERCGFFPCCYDSDRRPHDDRNFQPSTDLGNEQTSGERKRSRSISAESQKQIQEHAA